MNRKLSVTLYKSLNLIEFHCVYLERTHTASTVFMIYFTMSPKRSISMIISYYFSKHEHTENGVLNYLRDPKPPIYTSTRTLFLVALIYSWSMVWYTIYNLWLYVCYVCMYVHGFDVHKTFTILFGINWRLMEFKIEYREQRKATRSADICYLGTHLQKKEQNTNGQNIKTDRKFYASRVYFPLMKIF